jgi:hypothetical protein
LLTAGVRHARGEQGVARKHAGRCSGKPSAAQIRSRSRHMYRPLAS